MECFDNLSWPSLDDEIRPYIESGAQLLNHLRKFDEFEPLASELSMYSEKHQFCGTLDLLCYWQGKPAIVDWKSRPLVRGDGDQLGGLFILATEDVLGLPPEWDFDDCALIGVGLKRSGKQATWTNYDRRYAPLGFQAALTVYTMRKGRGLT